MKCTASKTLRAPRGVGVLGAIVGLLVLAVGGLLIWNTVKAQAAPQAATARVEKRTFKSVLHREGIIQPQREERIIAKLTGTIMEIALEGTLVKTGDVVMRLDAQPHLEYKAAKEEAIALADATYKKARGESLKALNLSHEDVKSYQLRLDLEQSRLEEIKRGPTPTDEVNAKVNLENNRMLYKAREEESEAIKGLADLNYASKEELRQKQLEVAEQQLKVVEMDIAQRKLHIIDPVKLAEQNLKVAEAQKTLNAVIERVAIIEKAIKRDDEIIQKRKERDEEILKDLIENVEKTVYRAPCDGMIVPRRARWPLVPGSDVYDGTEVLTIPDLSHMKVVLSVDEGHIGSIVLGLNADIVPAGWTGIPFRGAVVKISEQGRDEFELFQDDTQKIFGAANRKVFDVEIELVGHSSALRLGLRCDVNIVLGEIANAIVVPRAALERLADGSVSVDVVRPGPLSKPERRAVKVRAEGDFWAAVEGVSEGERVLLSEATPQ